MFIPKAQLTSNTHCLLFKNDENFQANPANKHCIIQMQEAKLNLLLKFNTFCNNNGFIIKIIIQRE